MLILQKMNCQSENVLNRVSLGYVNVLLKIFGQPRRERAYEKKRVVKLQLK